MQPRALRPNHIHCLQVLACEDGWLSAAELHTRGVSVSAPGAGNIVSAVVRMGLVDVQRTRNSHEGPQRYRLTVHGYKVLEMELAAGYAARDAALNEQIMTEHAETFRLLAK